MIIGLEVRHYKAYKNKCFIPIGHTHNFVAFAGENGSGKSSILEALNTFLNTKKWLLTKEQKATDSYICPIFLIPKKKIKRQYGYFQTISNFFWDFEQKDKTDKFFEIRDDIVSNFKDSHFLLFLGEDHSRKLKIPFGKNAEKDLLFLLDEKFNEKKFIKELKNLYSYVYIPVEIDSESFTKIETEEMQKIFNKEIKDEIKKSLKQQGIDSINQSLNGFVEKLEEKLEEKYFYDTGDEGTKKLTQNSLMETVLEIYFKRRVLMLGSRDNRAQSKKMSELSAGEKREALVNIIYVFLKKSEERDTIPIIGIDEPENSLHTSICYEQFEKLKTVSSNAQVFITTHWYGFLPIIDRGLVHFLKNKLKENGEGGIDFFQSTDLYLYPYQTKNIPKDFSLKSTNDLVQSIFHSLKAKRPYNWVICEGPSDKIYIEFFLKKILQIDNINVISVGGIELVKKFYKYLSLPISENSGGNKGKIFCLTDTDSNGRRSDIIQEREVRKNIIIKRLSTENYITTLIDFEKEEKTTPIDIEKSLHPTVFVKTLEALEVDDKFKIYEENIQNIEGNTTKENLRNFDIDSYFSDENTKNIFAKKYTEIMNNDDEYKQLLPHWINEVKEFFHD